MEYIPLVWSDFLLKEKPRAKRAYTLAIQHMDTKQKKERDEAAKQLFEGLGFQFWIIGPKRMTQIMPKIMI